MLEVDTWPDLHHPVLVVALRGWVDAGFAGAGAADVLREQLDAARRFARIDLAELVDLQQTRPEVQIVDGTIRRITWPAIECVGGRAGRDVVLVTGPEPSLGWPSVVRWLVDLAVRLGVASAYGLGAMPAVTTHRRPVTVLATATDPALAARVGALRADYCGMTGLQTALLVALGDAGIPGVGLWAQVPHYLAGSPSPPATYALLCRLAELGGLRVEASELERATVTYTERVEAGLRERPDVAQLVAAIEAEDPVLPAAADLVSEIERYLRSRPPGD